MKPTVGAVQDVQGDRDQLKSGLSAYMKACAAIFLCLAMISTGPGAAYGESPDSSIKRILVLSSYHQGYQWTDNQIAGIRDVLAASNYPIEIWIEYLDSRRFNYAEVAPSLSSRLAYRHFDEDISAVIALDNNALRFATTYRVTLFPEAPLIFAGINNFTPGLISGHSNVTGVVEELHVNKTLEFARRLQPKSRTLYVLADKSVTGQANLAVTQGALKIWDHTVQPVIVESSTYTDFETVLKVARPDDMVLYLAVALRDENGDILPTELALRELAKISGAPIYSAWDFMAGQGIVGGYLVSGKRQGETAASMALQSIAAGGADTIPILLESPNVYLADHQQLDRFNLSQWDLPDDVVLLNPPTWLIFWQTNWFFVLVGIAIAVGLLCLSIVLSINLRLRVQAQQDLQAHQEQLERLIESRTSDLENEKRRFEAVFKDVPMPLILTGADGAILQANPAALSLFGLSLSEMLGQSTEVLYEDKAEFDRVNRFREGVFGTKRIVRFEASYKRAGGMAFLGDTTRGVIFGANEEVFGHVAVINDITEQRAAAERLRESEERLALTMRATHDGIWDWDIKNEKVYYSDRIFTMLGFEPKGFLPSFDTFASLLHPDDAPKVLEVVGEYLEGKRNNYSWDIRMRMKNGGWLWVLTRGEIVEWDDKGQPTRMIGTHSDITRRKGIEDALRRSDQRARAIIDNASLGVVLLDKDFNYLQINDAWCNMMRHQHDQLIEKNHLDVTHPEDITESAQRLGQLFSGAMNRYRFEKRFIRGDGIVIWVEATVSPLLDVDGGVEAAVAMFNDITISKQAADRIKHMASHDGLTGLPNRALVLDRLNVAVSAARRDDLMLAVLFVDLDGFKQVNDNFGHEAGDALLQQAAKRLTTLVRDSDTVARIGGDEFLIVLPKIADRQDAETVAHKVVASMAQGFVVDGQELQIGCSIGLSVYPNNGDSADDLVRVADGAMYESKKAGKGRVTVAKPKASGVA